MIAPISLKNWLLHRTGTPVDIATLPNFVADSLDHNIGGPRYVDTFNRRLFRCFSGFIDLKGFSSYAHGRKPKEINDFLLPFLSQMIEALTSRGGRAGQPLLDHTGRLRDGGDHVRKEKRVLLREYLEQGWSKRAFAAKPDVSRRTIHHWTKSVQLERDADDVAVRCKRKVTFERRNDHSFRESLLPMPRST